MKLGCVLTAWGLSILLTTLWAAQVLPAATVLSGSPGTMPSSAASLESVQCPGMVSTKERGCQSEAHQADPGEAGFRFKGYAFSEPFHLIVSYDWLVLQGPAASIFEGDPLVLHCRAWQDWPLMQITFYRDGSTLGPPGPNQEFSVTAVQQADSGHYHCSATFRSPGPGSPETASPVAVTVQELFTDPVLSSSPSAELREGSPVTLHCQTKLSLQRPSIRLLFSFHQDRRTVRGRGLSAEFQVPHASQEHSGYYWCEVATEDGRVWKRSPRLEIRVQGPSGSAAPRTSDPTPQKPAVPEAPTAKPPGPLPPPPSPSTEHPSFYPADSHLQYQVGILLKQVQDVRALLGHLVTELRALTGRRKPGTAEAE